MVLKYQGEDEQFDPEWLGNTIQNALNSESDRAAPLIVQEWINDALELLLRTEFRANGISKSDQDSFVNGFKAPYSAFFSRVEACYAFGLISKDVRTLLHHLRVIRNHCSHFKQRVSPEDKKVEPQVRAIREFLYAKRFRSADHSAKATIEIICYWLMIYIEKQAMAITRRITAAIRRKSRQQLASKKRALLRDQEAPKSRSRRK
jgi:hypothetical protein